MSDPIIEANCIYWECLIKEQDKEIAKIGEQIKDLEKRLR